MHACWNLELRVNLAFPTSLALQVQGWRPQLMTLRGRMKHFRSRVQKLSECKGEPGGGHYLAQLRSHTAVFLMNLGVPVPGVLVKRAPPSGNIWGL